jgi:hypothetical protein
VKANLLFLDKKPAAYTGQLLVEALRRRDIAVVFRVLKTRGWSSAAIAAATRLSENRVRAVLQREAGRDLVRRF